MGRRKLTKSDRITAYLLDNPTADAKEVAKQVGCSVGYAHTFTGSSKKRNTEGVKEVATKKSPRFRSNILYTAEQIVSQDREREHGDASNNFKTISGLWSSYLGYYIPVESVPVMLMLLKVARTRENPSNIDNYVDMCGYASLAAEYTNDNK